MLPQLRCLITACDALSLPYSFFDDNQNGICVTHGKTHLFFVNCGTPFNSESQAQIAADKYFVYKLCKDIIPMPATQMYLDPFGAAEYRQYTTHIAYPKIVDDILKRGVLPVVIKPNHGARGQHVFLCKKKKAVEQSVATIFNHQDQNYHYILLAQEYIPIVHEFRVVTFKEKVILLYAKDTQNAVFAGNLSPLHYQNARAIHIANTAVIAKMESFLKPFFHRLPLQYIGFDIGMTAEEKLYLIEANTRPGFDYFIRDNGEEPIVELYKHILSSI